MTSHPPFRTRLPCIVYTGAGQVWGVSAKGLEYCWDFWVTKCCRSLRPNGARSRGMPVVCYRQRIQAARPPKRRARMMDAPAQQSIENDSRGGEYHSSNRILRSSGKHVKAGRGCPPPSRAVALDVVTQGKKLWRTLAGFRQLSARGATRGFRSREDQVSLATNRSRSAMFGEAGLFWRTKRWVLPTAPHFADWPPAAAAGSDKERAL